MPNTTNPTEVLKFFRESREMMKSGGATKDACYNKVKARELAAGNKWPSAYASGRLAKCRNVGASNYGNSKKKK